MKDLNLTEKEQKELNEAFKSLHLSKNELEKIKGGNLHNEGDCWTCDYHCTIGKSCTANWG